MPLVGGQNNLLAKQYNDGKSQRKDNESYVFLSYGYDMREWIFADRLF